MPGFKDMIKDFYAKYEPEKYSEEQVAKIESFYGSDYNKAIKDFYAKYEPEKYSEEQVKAVAEFYGLKKKETTESSLEDGSSVMPKQGTQKPSESSTSKRKVEEDLDYVAEIFSGYPGKELNEYTIIGGKWHIRVPGKSEFSEVRDVGSIQALNREFRQNVYVSKYRNVVIDEVGQKKQQEKEQLNAKLNSINGNLVDLEEDEAIEKLEKLFPDFKFETSGVFTDNVKVTAPGGVDSKTFPFDNFFSSDDSAVAKQLKSFLKIYSSKDLTEKMAKEQEIRDRQQKSILPTVIDLRTEGKSYLTKDIKELDILAEEGLPQKQMPDPVLYTKITREELDPAQKEMLESYNNAFIKLSLDKKTTASDIAALPKNKSVVKSIETANRLLEDKMGKYSSDLDEFNTLIESGEIDEETFNAQKAEFEKRREEIKDEVRMSTVGSKALSQAITNNSLIREEQGNFVSGMSRNFVSGLTSIGRITGMTAEEHQQLLDDIVGVGTTKDYIQSANRSDLVKAMFSVSESIGVAAPGLLTGGGSLVTGAGFFTQSFYEMKDELDEVEGLNGSDKFLMASAYGLVSAALENFGLGVALNKSKVGNALAKTALSRFLKEIPVNATKETIEQVLRKTTGDFVTELTTRGLKSSLAEGTTEALQYLSGEGVKELYDIAKDKDLFKHEDLLKQTWENFYIGAIAGGITSATNTSVEHARKFGIDKLENKQMATLMRELREPSALKEKKNFVNEQLKHGLITQEEAKATVEKYDAIHNALNTLPENIKPKVAKEALSLMAERKKLQSEIQGKEETLVVEQKERIKEINNKLTELGKTKEEDAFQEQTTDEGVLRQEESEVGLQEVEQRDQEQEVVAEEAQQEEVTSEDVVLKKGLVPKRNIDGTIRTRHPEAKGTFAALDENVAKKYSESETDIVDIKIPKGTTIETVEIDPTGMTTSQYNKAETDAINNSKAQVVKLITIENMIGKNKQKEEQYIVKDQSILEKSKEETFETLKSLDTKDKTNLQKVQSWLNKMDEDLDNFGKETLGVNIPVAVAKVVVKTVKTLVDAGVSLEQAIKQAAKDNNISETDVVEAFDKIQKKAKDTQASKAAKGISKKPTKKTTVNERTALRDQIKYAQKIAREIAKNTKEGQEAVRAHINERLKGLKATFNRTQFERAIKRAMKTRFYDAHDVARLNEYIDKIVKKAENFDKIKSALSLKSKIRKRLKNNQKDTKIAAKKFGAIDPIMVEDIDKYIAIAEKVYNAVKPTVLGAKRQDYKTATELDEVMAYAEAEVARQDEIRKQNLLASDKGQLLLMDGIISEDMSLKEIQDAMKEKSEELDEDFMQEIKDITSDMQDRVKEMEDVSEDIYDMANMDLESLSKKELVTLYEYLDNFLVNQTEDGTALFNSIIQGRKNAASLRKTGLRFKLKDKANNKFGNVIRKINYLYVLAANNQEGLLDRLLGSETNARLFKSVSGLAEFDEQKYEAQKKLDDILKSYDSKFSKIKDFKSTKNIFERGIYAYLSRNSEVDFKARKQNVLDTVEILESSKITDYEEIAKKLKKDIDRMNIKDAETINDIKVTRFNKLAVKFWQQKWSENYGNLKYMSSVMYNKDLNEDQDYTPDFYRMIESMAGKEGTDFIDSGNFGNVSGIDTSMPGMLMDSKTPNGLKGNKRQMYLDFDFDHNMATKMEEALKSIYAERQAVKIKSFLETKEFEDAFTDNNLKGWVKWVLDDYVNRSMKRSATESPIQVMNKLKSYSRSVNEVLDSAGLLGTTQVLGSITQLVKNVLPIIGNTYVTLGKNAKYLDWVLNKGEHNFIDNLNYPISTRGKEALTGIYKEMRYEKAGTSKVLRRSDKVSEFILDKTMGISDRYVARVSWMAYYKANLAEQGVKVGDIDWSTHKVNKEAAQYAQGMIDRQQNISDKDKKSMLDRSVYGKIITVIQPFSSFIMSAKFRIRNDINTLATSKADLQEGDKTKAALSLAGTIVEIATFQTIALLAREGFRQLGRMRAGDEEEDEKKYTETLVHRIVSQTINDVMSPAPMVDEFMAYMMNTMSSMMTGIVTSQKDINEYIENIQNEIYEEHFDEVDYLNKYKLSDVDRDELKDKYLKKNTKKMSVYRNENDLVNSLGFLGKSVIPIVKMQDIYRSIYETALMKYEDEMFGKNRYLPSEVKDLMYDRIGYSLGGVLSKDASDLSKSIDREIKKRSLSKSQYERYLETKSKTDSFEIDDIYLIKNTNLNPDEIADYAIRYAGENKYEIYKELGLF